VWRTELRERLTIWVDCCSYNEGMPTIAIERELREHFAAHPDGIIAAYLFGSVARGTAGVRSDVDVAVLFEAAPPATLEGLPVDLESRIARLVGRPTQVIVLNTAPVGLIHRVLRDGVLVLDRAPSARIRFEVRARNEFFDLQPVLARYRRRPLAPS
jgi:predicted nucleotidyltransferase